MQHMTSVARNAITEAMKASFPATMVVKVDPLNIDDSLLLKSVIPALVGGDIIAFPTETVYGLGANALDSSAISKIFKAKGRPSDNPLIVHISHFDQLKQLVSPDAVPQSGSLIKKLCDRFWPGPLTIIFPKNELVPYNVTAGLDQIAIRMPSHPVAKRILDLCQLPLAAPSANKSGRPSPTSASHVLCDLGRTKELDEDDTAAFEFGKGNGVGYIVDGGDCTVGVESTVVRVEDFKILRPGTVTLEQLREFDSRFTLFSALEKNSNPEILSKQEQQEIEKPSTPGLKYTHYSPSAPIYLFEFQSSLEQMQHKITEFIREQVQKNTSKKIGVLCTHEGLDYDQRDQVVVCCIGSSAETIAKNLFASFRYLDDRGVDVIIMEGISEENEGLAVMNRARKAAKQIL